MTFNSKEYHKKHYLENIQKYKLSNAKYRLLTERVN